MCYTPELAAEVTLQPIRRFGFDASIIFSDILVVPHAMGLDLTYKEGVGPLMQVVDSKQAIDALVVENVTQTLNPVFEALKIVKAALPKQTTLIGFAGAPWTVATYMIEGGSSKHYAKIKSFAHQEPESFALLLEKLVTATSAYLIAQIDAGAEVVQIFDSWSGVVSEADFEPWIITPTREIVSRVKAKHPNTPIIGFPKGAAYYYPEYIDATGVDAVGLDYTMPLVVAQELQKKVPVQGNLDPAVLLGSAENIQTQANVIMDALSNGPFIFNLGHGILPQTPIENVEVLIETVRSYGG